MSSLETGTYNSVYNQNILKNIFQPEYFFQDGYFQTRVVTRLPGDVIIGNSNTDFTLEVNRRIAIGMSSATLPYVLDASGSIRSSSNIVGQNLVAMQGVAVGGNVLVAQGNIVVASGNIVASGQVSATTLQATSSVIAQNIGSATLFCLGGGGIFPYVLQPAYISTSFSAVTDPNLLTNVPRNVVLPARTLLTINTTTTSITISNSSTRPVMYPFPFDGITPSLLTDSYILRAM